MALMAAQMPRSARPCTYIVTAISAGEGHHVREAGKVGWVGVPRGMGPATGRPAMQRLPQMSGCRQALTRLRLQASTGVILPSRTAAGTIHVL